MQARLGCLYKGKSVDEIAEELVVRTCTETSLKTLSRELVRIIDEEQHLAVYRALKVTAVR
jgi:hypothetical protein